MIVRLAILFLLALTAASQMPAQDREPGWRLRQLRTRVEDVRVVRVADGDSITVRAEGGPQRRIRLAGIDAPESRQPFGRAAKVLLSELVFGQRAALDIIRRDRYGREIAHVYVHAFDHPVNLEMVRRGFAWQFLRYDKSVALREAEQEARDARRGLWRDLGTAAPPVAPWEWRRGLR